MSEKVMTPEEMAAEVKRLASQLNTMGRNDLLFKAVGASLLEELKLEAAKTRLSRLVITEDYRFILADYQNKEIELQPVHKAVYLLFLAHPEGIEFKRLGDYKDELTRYYMATAKTLDKEKVIEGVAHLVNPLDNAINEKCSRIKKVFLDMMDEYTASYYIISGHTKKHVAGSSRIWYERLKVITLPRELVVKTFSSCGHPHICGHPTLLLPDPLLVKYDATIYKYEHRNEKSDTRIV